MDDDLSRLAADRQIDDDVFVYLVVVIKIVRIRLVKPDRFTRFRRRANIPADHLLSPGRNSWFHTPGFPVP